jgi:hypothetical protein
LLIPARLLIATSTQKGDSNPEKQRPTAVFGPPVGWEGGLKSCIAHLWALAESGEVR